MNQKGYTIPELVVVLIVSALLSGLIISFGFNYWRFGALQQADQDTLISRLDAGDYIRENIGESSGLIIQNSLVDNHVLKPDPAIGSGLYWLPLHAVPTTASIGNSGTITPLLYFRKLSTNKSKSVIMNGLIPYEDEYILYLNGTTKQLLARTIANPNATNNRLLTSCPAANASPSCPADQVIAEDVKSIATRYFSRTGALLDYSSSTDPNTGLFNGPDFPLVEVLELTINLQKRPELQTTNATQNNTIIRIALRNN